MTRTGKPPPPIDRGWAWVVAFGVFMNLFFLMGITKSCGMFMVEFINRFDVSTAYAGISITVASLVFALASPIAGVVGENITHRKLVIVGGILGMVGYSMCGLLVSMPWVIVFFALGFGVGNSCSYGSSMVMLGKYFRKHRSLATGFALSGTSIGQFAMPPIIEYLFETYGLGGTLIIIGALYFHCSLSGVLYRPIENYDVYRGYEDSHQAPIQSSESENDAADSHAKSNLSDNCSVDAHEMEVEVLRSDDSGKKPTKSPNEMDALCVDEAKERVKLSSNSSNIHGSRLSVFKSELLQSKGLTYSCNSLYLNPPEITVGTTASHSKGGSRMYRISSLMKLFIDFSILRNYLVIHFGLVSFLAFMAMFNFVILSPGMVVARGMTKYDKATLISLCGVGDLIARICVGFIGDRNYIQRYKMQFIAMLVLGINMVVFTFANSFLLMAICCVVYGIMTGTYVCLLPVVMLDFLPLDSLSKALGMVILSQGLAGVIGVPMFSAIVDATGSYDIVLAIMAVVAFLGAALLLFTPFVSRLEKKKCTEPEQDIEDHKGS